MSLIATRPGSLVDKLKTYYAANPSEELSYADICLKYGVSYRSAVCAVDRMKAVGIVEVAHVVRLRVKVKEVA